MESAATCTPGTRHFGNEGRNSLIGPAFREVDFSIFKNTSLTERVKMELRFEAYNLFNHPNFASPLWPNFLSDPTNTNSFGSNGRLQGYLPINVTADVGAGYPVHWRRRSAQHAGRCEVHVLTSVDPFPSISSGPGSLSPGPFSSVSVQPRPSALRESFFRHRLDSGGHSQASRESSLTIVFSCI